MAKVDTAPFVQEFHAESAVCTAACVIGTAGTPTNTVLLATGGAADSLITGIAAMPRATVAATGLYLFLSKDGGATKSLLDSALMAAYTLTAATKVPKTKFDDYTQDTPGFLGNGHSLYVGIAVALAGGIEFHAQVSDYLTVA